jgi:hypothetical protein
MTLTRIPRGTAKSNTMVHGTVVTDFCGLTDYNAHAMINKETATNTRPRMDFNASQKTPSLRNQTSYPL